MVFSPRPRHVCKAALHMEIAGYVELPIMVAGKSISFPKKGVDSKNIFLKWYGDE